MDGVWTSKIGKRVKIIFDDGIKVTPKTGILTGEDATFLFLKSGDSPEEGIARSKIIRIEVES